MDTVLVLTLPSITNKRGANINTAKQNSSSVITPIPAYLASDIEKMPTLSTLLPFTFGKSKIEGIFINCATCNTELSSENTRGEIETIAGGKTASVKAYALCFGCRTVTPIEAKFHDNGSALYKGPNGWTKGKWDARPVRFFAKVSNFIQQRWQQVVPPVIALVIVLAWVLRRVQ